MKNLKAAAKELNEVFGLDPVIKIVGVKRETLEDSVKEAAGLYDPENDELSEETLATLYEIGALEVADEEPEEEDEEPEEEPEEAPAPKKAPAKTAKKKAEPEPDPEPEEEEEEEDDDEMDELIAEIQDAKNAKELKAIIKREDVFQPLRKKAPGMFDEDELRELMVDLLVADKEPEPEPKAAPKKPAATKPAATKKTKEGGKPGVIATIASLVEKAPKKGISKEEILEQLVEAFPEKSPDSMKNTVNVQLPGRMSRERFEVAVLEGPRYKKA